MQACFVGTVQLSADERVGVVVTEVGSVYPSVDEELARYVGKRVRVTIEEIEKEK